MPARLAVKITGMGVAYPPTEVLGEELEKTAYATYKHSPAYYEFLPSLAAF
jgi:hypothetical protein